MNIKYKYLQPQTYVHELNIQVPMYLLLNGKYMYRKK